MWSAASRRRSNANPPVAKSIDRPRKPGARLFHDVVQPLIHGAGGFRAAGPTHHPSRHTGNGRVSRHRLEHHRAGSDACTLAHLDVAENLRAGANEHAATDFGMAVAVLLSGTAKSHVLKYGYAVLDDRGFADHESGGVVEENAAADARRGIDVGLEHRR